MKRKLLILSLLVILAALTAAGTLAYYTDSARTHNVITSGKVNIALLEWADEARTKPFKDKQGVMPGTKVTKIVEVKNTGTGAAFVRLRVETEVRSAEKQEMDPKHVRLDFNQTDWIYRDGYYYYARSLQPGETTEPLFTAVTFAAEMGNEYQNATAHVNVSAYAVQSANNGDDPLNAEGWPSDALPEPTAPPEPTAVPTNPPEPTAVPTEEP